MKTFNLIDTPLTGTNLIEASAGTGKTYTIAGLFLRLIIEERFLVDQILVVTFTKAATEELKKRIRDNLFQTKEAFLKGSCDNDDFIDAFVKKHQDAACAVQLLEDALVDFDMASIFTIHSFCQKILNDNAFETGCLFDTELIADSSNLMQEVADDFWRIYFYKLPQEFTGFAVKKLSGPEYFFKLLSKAHSPEINIIPDIKQYSTEKIYNYIDDYRKILKELKTVWPLSRNDVMRLLKDQALKGNIYGNFKPDAIQPELSVRDVKVLSMIESMDGFIDSKSPGFPIFKTFEKFTATKINLSVKKNHRPPIHEFFDVCDRFSAKAVILESEMEKYLLFLKVEFFRFAEFEINKRKKKSNIQFFDDLLIQVKKALEGKGKNELSKAIREKYKAALVDEFQDTDSVQYDIFSHLFSSDQSVLFMIGDPKQAIYGFRGADIFSYLKAAHHADSKYTLTKNFRSNPDLITAVNTIFSNIKKPFVFDEILFEKAISGKKLKPVESPGTPFGTPFKLWYLSSKGISVKGRPINKTEAVQIISKAVANEIYQLISSAHSFKEGNIAVLVRTNRQAQIIKKDLFYKNITSVLFSTENIFDSSESEELERILNGINNPYNNKLIKAALATDIMGITGRALDPEGMNPYWWETKLADLKKYFQLWTGYGFMRMFGYLIAKEKVKERLLLFEDGERRLTNVLHLAELLHQESIETKPGMTGLIKWLSIQRDPSSARLEKHQLRLESDEHAVKIVTIHKSKGLEYDVVFCPFGWDGSLIKDNEIIFHNNDDEKRLTLDLCPKENSKHIICAQYELLAENLRLFYVALTRAKSCCYLVWGRINTAETSAMAYLFHHKKNFDTPDITASLNKSLKGKSDDDIFADLRYLADRADGCIELSLLPVENSVEPQQQAYSQTLARVRRNNEDLHQDEAGQYTSRVEKKEILESRKFSGKIDHAWKISSYSSLVSGRSPVIRSDIRPDMGSGIKSDEKDENLFDRDKRFDLTQHIQAIQPESAASFNKTDKPDIFSFPKGAHAGIFFHDIFENLDYAAKDPEHQQELVINKLKEYGFDLKWEKSVCSMIKNVLSTPLSASREKIILSSVKQKDRINEMEFYFPINRLTPLKLKQIFADTGGRNILSDFPEQLEKLNFAPAKGFMKGYIDLIFYCKERYYLVDWKSNFLGSSINDYGKDSLDEIMRKELYILQYHLYALALHQYLRFRIQGYRYETVFGGIFYIFIRGVNSDQGDRFGVYHDLPSQNLIHELGRSLIPGYKS